MACSINIDCLSLHNLKRDISDSIVFKYDETKMDKTGEFVQEKNCCSIPFEGSRTFLFVYSSWLLFECESRAFVMHGNDIH